METTEKIVEAYVRYVKGWATIPNLRCAGQKEIDLFAIDPVTDERWHIETSVSISSGFSKLTDSPFDPADLKIPVKAATARRTLGFFVSQKFGPPSVERLCGLGCTDGAIRRAIVTWDWKAGLAEAAASHSIELWRFPDLMRDIAALAKTGKGAFTWPGPMDVPHAFAYLPDLGRVFAEVAEHRGELGRFETLHFEGHTLTGEATKAMTEKLLGRPLKRAGVPWTLLRAAGLFIPMMRELAIMSYLWRTPHSLDGSKLKALLPDFRRTEPEAALAEVIAALGRKEQQAA